MARWYLLGCGLVGRVVIAQRRSDQPRPPKPETLWDVRVGDISSECDHVLSLQITHIRIASNNVYVHKYILFTYVLSALTLDKYSGRPRGLG